MNACPGSSISLPGHPEGTTSVHDELVSLLPRHPAMNIPTSPLPLHWGRGNYWTPSDPGPHLLNLPPLGFAEMPTRILPRYLDWRAPHLTILPSSLPLNTTQKHGRLSNKIPSQRPRRTASLGREGGGEGPGSPARRLTFSLLLGDHWRWLRKGLAYLTIGSRVGGCWRAKKRQERETMTATRRETG